MRKGLVFYNQKQKYETESQSVSSNSFFRNISAKTQHVTCLSINNIKAAFMLKAGIVLLCKVTASSL